MPRLQNARPRKACWQELFRPVRPVVTRRQLSLSYTQPESKFTFCSAVEIHIKDMPAEC